VAHDREELVLGLGGLAKLLVDRLQDVRLVAELPIGVPQHLGVLPLVAHVAEHESRAGRAAGSGDDGRCGPGELPLVAPGRS
jgi:hypothetical protein